MQEKKFINLLIKTTYYIYKKFNNFLSKKMKANKLFYFLFFLYLINGKPISESNSKDYKYLRSLWEERMEYEKRNNEDDNLSLEVCANSNYKYFSFILSGAPVTFDHFINIGNAVSI
jgi:hypothetical protein